jgi:hypothetical protein
MSHYAASTAACGSLATEPIQRVGRVEDAVIASLRDFRAVTSI